MKSIKRKSKRKLAGLILFCLSIAGFGFMEGKADKKNKDLPQRDKLSTELVDFSYDFLIETLDGEKIEFSKFKGKTIFVNLWATWCGPCIEEMPGIQRLYDKVKNDKIIFAIISLDEGKLKPKKFIQKRKYTFPVYQFESGVVPDVFQTSSIPTTFVITPDGKIIYRREGMNDYDNEMFVSFLKKF